MKGFSCAIIKERLRMNCQVVENKKPKTEGKIIHITIRVYFLADEGDKTMEVVLKISCDSHMVGCFIN